MSKAKVEEYKNYKKNKKKILAKEHRKKVAAGVIWRLIGVLILAGVIALVCIKGLSMYSDYLAGKPDYSTSSFIIGDMCGIDETETEEPETEETKADEETTAEKETDEAETTADSE